MSSRASQWPSWKRCPPAFPSWLRLWVVFPKSFRTAEAGYYLSQDPKVADVSAAIEAFADMPKAEYDTYAHAAWSTWSHHYNADVNYPRFVTNVSSGGGHTP